MKNSRQIAGGVAGAVTGFVAVLLILVLTNFGNPADPIASGLLALLVLAPAGAIAGLVLGTKSSRPVFGILLVVVATFLALLVANIRRSATGDCPKLELVKGHTCQRSTTIDHSR